MEKDFIRDRLIPFFIGLAVNIGFTVLCSVLYLFTIFIFGVGSLGLAARGDGFGAVSAVLTGIPLVLLIFLLGLAFWLLNTWLLGCWTQAKYRDYKQKRSRPYDSRAAYFAEQSRKEQEKQFRQEAEWEAEWNMMKKQGKENFSDRKPEKSQSAGQTAETNMNQAAETPNSTAKEAE